jgi:DNA-binding transcriptional regulator YiaG
VTNHPNRNAWQGSMPPPSPEEIVRVRQEAELTQARAAEVAGVSSQVRWAEYETGVRRPHWALWELFLLRIGRHPDWRLVRKATPR